MSLSPEWIRLQSDQLTVAIDPLGAQLSVLRDAAGRDLLWDGNPAFWAGRAPILFPIVGALNRGLYRWCDKTYVLPRHGFARGRRFGIVAATAQEALFRLCSDSATLAVYPFAFELDLRYALHGGELSITVTVRNRGQGPMPASVGFHPAFRWPLPYGAPRSAHRLEFEVDEPAPVRRLDADGLLVPAVQATPVSGRMLLLDDALFAQDVVIFDQLRSRRLRYGASEGPGIDVRFPDARYLGLWSRPGAPFVCIEPWRGVADPAGFEGNLQEKPGIEMLERPADALSTTMVIELSDQR
jgi:galactose mutarotase-like enzyme